MSGNISYEDQDRDLLRGLVRKCVHCGFCNSVCPSYQELGNELDGPRGRIYQISAMVSGDSDAPSIRHHLDSCLNCRSCETACPSGVEYSKIFALGSQLATRKYPYSSSARVLRFLLSRIIGNPVLCNILFTGASFLRPLLPSSLGRMLPKHNKPLPLLDSHAMAKKVLLIQGCVQSAASQNTNRALHNLCSRLDMNVISVTPASCCGAIDHHLNYEQDAIKKAQANIDACQSYIEMGVEAISMPASACVLELKEYPHLLRHDRQYADKAQRFADLVKDPSLLLLDNGFERLGIDAGQVSLAFHTPCTLQHGQQNNGQVERLLHLAGFKLHSVKQKQMCCGSAGTYSLLQPVVAKRLRADKIAKLTASKPEYLATANIGCQLFLQQTTDKKIWHWLDLVEHFANRKR